VVLIAAKMRAHRTMKVVVDCVGEVGRAVDAAKAFRSRCSSCVKMACESSYVSAAADVRMCVADESAR
jgi:hypothetical protein